MARDYIWFDANNQLKEYVAGTHNYSDQNTWCYLSLNKYKYLWQDGQAAVVRHIDDRDVADVSVSPAYFGVTEVTFSGNQVVYVTVQRPGALNVSTAIQEQHSDDRPSPNVALGEASAAIVMTGHGKGATVAAG